MNDPEIAEIFAYDDDLTTTWASNPDTEPEVSITFDLGTPIILNEIGIHFWDANQTTTTFSIAIGDNATGPFVTVINTATSTSVGATVETEQLFSLGGTIGRFVKFIGIGNSSSSNWVIIPNINIYGSNNCQGICSVHNQLTVSDPITAGIYGNAQSIQSSDFVDPNIGLVEFKGENDVLLLPGFEAKLGSEFHAYTEECNH